MCADGNGRWFSFNVTPETVFLLEKKGLPPHLVSLSCVDCPTFLRDVMLQLEDAGEVWVVFYSDLDIKLRITMTMIYSLTCFEICCPI